MSSLAPSKMLINIMWASSKVLSILAGLGKFVDSLGQDWGPAQAGTEGLRRDFLFLVVRGHAPL